MAAVHEQRERVQRAPDRADTCQAAEPSNLSDASRCVAGASIAAEAVIVADCDDELEEPERWDGAA